MQNLLEEPRFDFSTAVGSVANTSKNIFLEGARRDASKDTRSVNHEFV
jgi:hypothetical protein